MRVLLSILLLAAFVAPGCMTPNDAAAPADNATTNATGEMPGMNMSGPMATIELGESSPAPGAPAQGPGSMYLKVTGMDGLVVGKTVMVNVTNKGAGAHDVVMSGNPDFKSGSIAAGKSVTITWTPTKDGTFDVYCDMGAGVDPTGQVPVADHRAQGMAGKVTVKKAA